MIYQQELAALRQSVQQMGISESQQQIRVTNE